MTEEVKPEVIKRTQELLGTYFKKPPLTEKLLKKPPFRFLHDIITAVIRETGFLDGLFSETEMNSDNIKDKEGKLAYLTKLIDVVKLITGNNLTVRASKIVAGHEPTKTNELLQAIGKALRKQVSSSEAIEHYKNSRSRSKVAAKTKLAPKDESKKLISRQSSQSRKPTEKDKPSIPDQKKKSTATGKVAPKEAKVHGEDKREKHREQGKENKTKETVVDKDEKVVEIPSAESAEDKRTSSVKQRQRRSASVQRKEDPLLTPKTLDASEIKPALVDSTNSPTHTTRDSPSHNTKSKQVKQKDLPNDKTSESRLSARTEGKTKSADDNASKKSSHSENKSKKIIEQDSNSAQHEAKPKSSPLHKEKESTALLSPRRKISNSETVPNKIEKQHTFENPGSPPPKFVGNADYSTDTTTVPEPTIARPRTSLRPPSARPMSARPAAPRIRSRAEFMFNEDITTPMGSVNVIVENFDTKDEDDIDNMVVMETGGNGDSLNIDGLPRTESQLSAEHGHLVAQILETQKELINTDNVDVMPKKVEIIREWEAGSRRDRESTIKEVDKLRGSIQTLTRATNPLGKLLDYLQEDVEMMQKELQEWRSQYNQLSEQLQQEQISTQESIEPMKGTLGDIEGNIKVQLDKICQVKAAIMKNDQKIQRLLNGYT